MFEIHSRSMGLSVFSGVYLFSEAYLNGGALFFSRLCATLPSCLLLVTNTDTHRHTQTHKHTHIPAERPNPTLHILTHTGASRPQIQASRCCHGDHFDPVSTSEVCLERGNLPPPHPSLFPRPLPSSFSFQGKKKKKILSTILKSHDYSFSYSFSQIHSPTMFGTRNLLSSYSHSHSIQPF